MHQADEYSLRVRHGGLLEEESGGLDISLGENGNLWYREEGEGIAVGGGYVDYLLLNMALQ